MFGRKQKKTRWAGKSSLKTTTNSVFSEEQKTYHSNFPTSLPSYFFERDEINAVLEDIGKKNIIVMYGMGGIGKTTMLTKLCETVRNDKNINCRKVAYYDLKNKNSFASIAKSILADLFDETRLPDDERDLIDSVIAHMTTTTTLIVLDNLESLMDVGDRSGKMLPEFQAYAQFIDCVLSISSLSTLVLSGREMVEISSRYSEKVLFCQLRGISIQQAKILLNQLSLNGTDSDWYRFVSAYSGNALTLKIVGYEISERFEGDISAFLDNPEMPHELIELLDEQFSRFTLLEKIVLFLCAVAREPVNETYIDAKLVEIKSSRSDIKRALKNIANHCHVESTLYDKTKYYYLQPVIMEFLSEKLIDVFQEEIIRSSPKFISLLPLIDTVAKEYILNIQKIILVNPLKNALLKRFGTGAILNQLHKLRKCISETKNYAAGNIIVLLSAFNEKIVGWDFSNLYIINADLRNLQIHDCNFSNSIFENVLFKNTFGNLIDVRYSYDGSMIIGGATDYSLNAWSCRDLSFSFKLKNHTDWIRSVDSSPKYLVSASNDESINVYDYNTHRLIKTFKPGCRVRKVLLSNINNGFVYSSGDNGIVYKWSIEDETCVAFNKHQNVVWNFALVDYKENHYLISVSDDKTAIAWDLDSGKYECIISHDCELKSITWDNKNHLFFGCENGDIIIYSLDTSAVIQTVKGHQGTVWSMAFDISSNRLISGSADRNIIVWKYEKNLLTKEKILDAHNSGIWNVNFNKTGDRFVSTGDDSEFKVWDGETYRELYCVKGYTNLLRNIYVSDINQSLYVAGDDMVIREYSLSEPLTPKRRFTGHTNRVRHIDISNDGKRMLSCGDDGVVILWNLITTEKKIFRGHQKRVWSVCFISEDVFASVGEENDIYLWHSNEDTPFERILGHKNWIWDISYNPISDVLITASEDNTCMSWHGFKFGRQIEGSLVACHKKWLFSATPNSNGEYVVTSSADNTAYVCNVKNAEIICELVGHTGWVWSAIFIENDIIVTGSQDSTIRVWKIDYEQKTSECIKVIEAHKSWVVSLAYSAKLQRFFSASADETVKAWDSKTFQYIEDYLIDKPYNNMLIDNVQGLTISEKESLVHLGAKL